MPDHWWGPPSAQPFCLAAPVKNVTIKGFTIEGFSENGIWPYYAEKFKIIENTVGDSEHVGIYPYLSYNGLVKENVSYGGMDSALWVAGSERIRVVKNVVYEAPTGLQVSVSRHLKFSRNQAYNNVVGLGIYHSNATASDDEPGIAVHLLDGADGATLHRIEVPAATGPVSGLSVDADGRIALTTAVGALYVFE